MSTTSTQGMIALCASLTAIITVIVGLRLYARKLQKAPLGPDDWVVIPGYITFIGMVALGLLGVHLHQFGYDKQEVAAYGLRFGIQADLVFSLDVLSCATLGFSKISALLFYRRIFCVSGRLGGLRLVIHVLITIISLWMIAFIILPILQCGPDLRKWDLPNRSAVCFGTKIILGFVISDFILEVTVIGLPIPRIITLKTSTRRRLAVLFVFLTAFVSLGAATARLVIVNQILSHSIADLALADTEQAFLWILEAGFALIAVNLPTLWWFRNKVSPEGVLGSIRSVISLRSFRSDSSGQRGTGRDASTAAVSAGAKTKREFSDVETYPSVSKSSI